jgi:Ran-binding protein 3
MNARADYDTVMRKEAVYSLLLNVTLFSGMRCFVAQDPRYLRFSVIEGGATTHYNLRVSCSVNIQHERN